MADAGLQGRLADFTLEEILQLIALQQKTGLLTVDASYPMVLAFESGMLVGYRDARRLGSDPLEAFLKSYGFFGSETWEHIDFVQRHSKLDLTEILVNEAVLEADELANLQMEAAQEDIFRGMQLRDGRYHFMPGRDGMAGLKGRVRIKVDGLLMEAVRRIDEFDSLRQRFWSNDLKIKIADPSIDTAERSNTERRLLALLNRNPTLGQVVAQARMAEFDTLSMLDGLREDGLIILQTLPRARSGEAEVEIRDLRRDRTVRKALLISTLSFGLAVAVALWQPWAGYRASETDAAGRAFLDARDQAHLEAAVQLFEEAHGRWPGSIEELAKAGWISNARALALRDRFELRTGGDVDWRVRRHPESPSDGGAIPSR